MKLLPGWLGVFLVSFAIGTSNGEPIEIIVQFTDMLVGQNGMSRHAAGHVSRIK